MLTVEQADRDAANAYRDDALRRLMAGDPGGWKDTPEDHLVQAFAAHRIAGEQAGRVAGLEEAAGVCENHMADCLEDRDIQRRWPEMKARDMIYAAYVRALKGPQG